ncbi:hypothetical protein TrVFT333_007735 [Trichoderma virens FT-333]|nr:hypothetical protein TrVFT333_007735 [Trichoderma virens FT-333]
MDSDSTEKGAVFETPVNPVSPVNTTNVDITRSTPVLEKRFNLLSACATGITTGNTWTALGGAIIASLYNGGPPGIIYEFIAVSVFYWFIAASIAELASAIPASGGVYHWATVTAGPRIGSFLIVGGLFVTIVVCAVMPSRNGKGYASNKFVWSDWSNGTGYSSNAFVFLAGMLNGAFAVGTPDCVTHIAEEIPQAARNLPKVLLCQVAIGFVTAICYMISMFYAINDLPTIFEAESICPLGDIYLQATGSKAGALGLLLVIMLPIFCATIGCYITAGRTLYTLGRDNAAPFASKLGAAHSGWERLDFW